MFEPRTKYRVSHRSSQQSLGVRVVHSSQPQLNQVSFSTQLLLNLVVRSFAVGPQIHHQHVLFTHCLRYHSRMPLSPVNPSSKKKYTCPYCFREFIHASSHTNHVRSHNSSLKPTRRAQSPKAPLGSLSSPSDSPGSIKCLFEDCEQSFNNYDGLISHVKACHHNGRLERLELFLVFGDEFHHPALESSPVEKSVGEQTEKSLRDSIENAENGSKAKFDEKFVTTASFDSSSEALDGSKCEVTDPEAEKKVPIHPAKYPCQLCRLALRDKHVFRRHMKNHDMSLPLACDACPMRFTNSSGLRLHYSYRHGPRQVKSENLD